MTAPNKKIYLSPPHMSGNEMSYIQDAFDTNWIAPLGPHVDAFEKELAAHVGVKDAAAVSSGTAAIHLALQLIGVKEGDTVFCSSLTFVASANPIVYCGARPIFIDSEPETWNMSPQALEYALHEADREGHLPKAVIVVNLYGQSAKMDDIIALCDAYGIPVIEDAAESLGSSYKGKASGSFGKYGVYSFNGNKIISTSGGGMLISDDVEQLQRARFFATQARDQAAHYQHSQLGFNYRMSNVLAGIGRAQLAVLEDRVSARRRVFDRYQEALAYLPGVQLMPELADTRSNRWLTVLTLEEREAGTSVREVLAALGEQDIEARPVWKPLHLQPIFKGASFYAHRDKDNVSERLFHTGICLPSGSQMTEDDQHRVIACIQKTMKQTIHSN
ncbi:aminotransferase class I/II-fold pyridoxal phosphate-dependent enzyme [Paenibacillus sp. HWE-109]|uniref:DegT/DnrJ/EryC1/StrS family aminotransferase n=1 Tax=Paenibacillus sp. HWE-109 TaxID=1306526 RepID=UPI001EDFAAE0|nr:aminotransferase class I/II-fold pyridoxal phosphate-dependent enzyme [Paenibacillus sp. HWE-109]UKS24904.1 aminotransferase class I/II-fold pyridoxal phosphate-dependent enzyme [Paenibacillus sp. HWE-109]